MDHNSHHNMAFRRPPMTRKTQIRIFERDSYQCQYCGKMPPEVKLEVDHMTPVSKGGNSDDSNLITACNPCNMSKQAKLPTDFTTPRDNIQAPLPLEICAARETFIDRTTKVVEKIYEVERAIENTVPVVVDIELENTRMRTLCKSLSQQVLEMTPCVRDSVIAYTDAEGIYPDQVMFSCLRKYISENRELIIDEMIPESYKPEVEIIKFIREALGMIPARED